MLQKFLTTMLLTICTPILIAEIAVAKDIVPLKRGYYMNDIECKYASNASLDLFLGDVFRNNCSVTAYQKSGDIYKITESCVEKGIREDIAATYMIISNTEYIVEWGGSRNHFRYCPQSALPEPWRSNNIDLHPGSSR